MQLVIVPAPAVISKYLDQGCNSPTVGIRLLVRGSLHVDRNRLT
jgi:hypothetical protein